MFLQLFENAYLCKGNSDVKVGLSYVKYLD